MNKRAWIVGVISAVLLLMVVGTAVAAPGDPAGPREPGQRPALRAVMNAVLAETGLTVQEVREQLADGQTLAAVIEANGGSVQNVIDAAVSAATEQINQAVANGRMTQEQADQLLAELPDVITRAVNGELAAQGDRGPLARASERILVRAAADATGLEPSAIVEQVRAGQTLAEVITANGGSVEAVVSAAVTEATAEINQAVADGKMTQERADQLISRLPEVYTAAVNGELRERAMEARAAVGVIQLAAEQTGLSVQDIRQQLRDGQTLAAVLTANGVEVNAFIDTAVSQVQERLSEAVANGRLTQEQADERIQQFRERLTERINNPAPLEAAPVGGV
ncbi:MAG: hypothetical protein JNM70_06955 [Anaerolineae bacterium]|nr:hypothetical protein [Anaerolineae bacterium]